MDGIEALRRQNPELWSGLVGLMRMVVGASPRSRRGKSQYARRLFITVRFMELRDRPELLRESDLRIFEMACRDARRFNPAWRGSISSFRSWKKAWNGMAVDGLAAAWRGLSRPHREASGKKHFGRSGRPRKTLSPEAVRLFDSIYLDPSAQTIAAVHRTVAKAADLAGWEWHATEDLTRAWLAYRRRSGDGKRTRSGAGRTASGRRSKRA